MENMEVREQNLAELKRRFPRLFLFGAGKRAKYFLNYFEGCVSKYLDGILVTDPAGNPSELDGIRVSAYQPVSPDKNTCVIMTPWDSSEITETLKSAGFEHILPLETVVPVYQGIEIARYLTRDHELKRYIEYFHREKPLFRFVEIETVNRCNGGCAFCPVNANAPQRPYRKMTDGMFQAIIDQLAALDYQGALALYSNNEPFLDERIADFAKYARQTLSNAEIYLYTNGTLVTPDKFREIIPYLDYIQFDDYSAGEMPENIREIQEECRKTGILSKFVYGKIDREAVRGSRGGNAPNSKVWYTTEFLCPFPYLQVVIRPDGKVSLCCNDALGENTLGDLNENSLLEIWEGEKFQEAREKLSAGRAEIATCRYCNNIDERELWKNIRRIQSPWYQPELLWEKRIFPGGVLTNKRVYIFGSGNAAEDFYRYMTRKGARIDGFLENDKNFHHGKKVCGKPVKFVSGLAGELKDAGVYILTPHRYTAVFCELAEFGVKDIKVVFSD